MSEDGAVIEQRNRPKPYQCHECRQMLADYEVFESGWPKNIRHWCMNHIPWRSNMRLWWQEADTFKAWTCIGLAVACLALEAAFLLGWIRI